MKKIIYFLGIVNLFLLPTQTLSGTLGDINSDGKIDLQEAIYALQVVAGIKPQTFSTVTINGTYQIPNFPQVNTGEFVFKSDGTFTSVFYENSVNLSGGTYTYDSNNSIITLDFIFSTNENLQGTNENHSVTTLNDNILTISGATFYSQN